MLRIDEVLSTQAKEVFNFLAKQEEMKAFCLIGGTAMALQVNHRKSEDLDFCCFSKQLNQADLNEILLRMKIEGFDVELATPASVISQSWISGVDVLALARDYAINGVKVTFFARNDTPYNKFCLFERLPDQGLTFDIMGLDGLFAMKSHVIHKRVASRDLFDLKWFVENGVEFRDVLTSAVELDPGCSKEYAIAVLTGLNPMPAFDPGLKSVSDKTELSDIYSFFKDRVAKFESSIARDIKKCRVCSVCGQMVCKCSSLR